MGYQVEDVIKRAVADGEIAGMNLLIKRKDQDLIYVQEGYADIATKKPYNRDTINRIYSMSKPITAAAVMLLYERGQLSLNAPIEKFLPGFHNQFVLEDGKKVPVKRSCYVKDCLNMTSGLLYGGDNTNMASVEAQKVFDEIDQRLDTNRQMTTEEVCNRLGQSGLDFHPGEKWKYGTSADILGAVVEKVTEMSFGEFLKQELFIPLEMEDTGFYIPQEKQDRLSSVYQQTSDGLKLVQTRHLGMFYRKDKKPAFESGGAGLASTIDDYGKFAYMLLNHGNYQGRQILKPETVEFFTQGHQFPWAKEYMWRTWDSLAGHDYANLLRVSTDPAMGYYQTWQNEYGWDGWLGTYFCNVPSKSISILAGMQLVDAGGIDLMQRIRNVLITDSRI